MSGDTAPANRNSVVKGVYSIERYNGTDRHRNSRKTRKTYRFSKDWDQHNASTYFTVYST